MLKIRLQGTREDIGDFKDFLEKEQSVEVIQFSDIYENKGTKKYFRMYGEIQQREMKGDK